MALDSRSRNALRIASPEDISLKELRYKYPTRPPLTLEAEVRQVSEAVKRGYPRLTLRPLRDDALSVVGYGPSLNETWDKITHPCISTSGAHDFLIDRGFVPDYHAQMDGRDHQAKFLEKPNKDVTYVMASVCAAAVFDRLEGHKVLLWHNCHGQHILDWIGLNDPGGLLIAGGSNIGLSSIHIGGILGFRKFRLFGFDGNYRGNARHAGAHPDQVPQNRIKRCGWWTSPQMSNACDEFIALQQNPNLEFDVYGTSLLTTLLEWTSTQVRSSTADSLAAVMYR